MRQPLIVGPLAGLLLISLAPQPQAAVVASPELPAARAPLQMPIQPGATTAWHPSPELLAQAAGALVGFGTYSMFLAPAASTGGVVGLLGDRLMATVLATGGAVSGTYIYDRWAGSPIDYAYFWHRGGFVIGMAAGIATFGVLGYPLGTDATWLGWTANRAALMGSGLLGSWGIDHWYASR